MDAYQLWRAAVLAGIGAPENPDTVAIIDAWAHQETYPYYLMRWNNPLNTTQKEPGSWDSGAQPGPHDVQVFPNIRTGVRATVATLLNGYYGQIVDFLRRSVPPSGWRADPVIAHELATWGTGAGFLGSIQDPPAPPPPPAPGPVGILAVIEIHAGDTPSSLTAYWTHHGFPGFTVQQFIDSNRGIPFAPGNRWYIFGPGGHL